MLASLRQGDEFRTGTAWQHSFREVCQAAIRVFNLMDKHQTAPFPNAYAVLFAYTTGSNEALVTEVNNLLLLKDQLSPYDIESLFQEYLTEDAGAFATKDIGKAIGDEIGSVLEIIEKGLKQSDDFTQSLDSFSEKVPQATSNEGLASVVVGLLDENRRMAELTRDLNQGLAKSQALIGTLNKQLDDVQAQALRDPITNALNRRAFDQRIAEAAEAATKLNEGFFVTIAQLDHFEQLNQTYGTSAGDTVLKGFADLLMAGFSDKDIVSRYGGQEFALVFTANDVMSAYNQLVKLKHEFRKLVFTCGEDNESITSLTASFGLARYEPGMAAQEAL